MSTRRSAGRNQFAHERICDDDINSIVKMPAGLAFHLNYMSNAVQLEVVNKEFFEADFDEDGDVDPTDYGIWKNAFGLNQLGDANGDNNSDAADYTIWRNQLGSVSGGGAGAGFDFGPEAVPEPGTVLLISFFVIPLAWARRKRSRSSGSTRAGRHFAVIR